MDTGRTASFLGILIRMTTGASSVDIEAIIEPGGSDTTCGTAERSSTQITPPLPSVDSREQITLLPDFDLFGRYPVPQKRLRDLQIPSQLRDPMLAGAVLVNPASKLHCSTTEVRRMRSRHTDSLSATSAAHGRCPEEQVNSSRNPGIEP